MARAVPRTLVASSYRALRFGLVGLTGVAVNQAVIVLLTEFAGLHYLASAIIATESSTAWNFVWIDRWALARRARGSVVARLLAYGAINNASLVIRLPLLWLLTDFAGISYGFSNLVTLGVLFVLRFAISDRWIWGSIPSPTAVAVASVVPLSENQRGGLMGDLDEAPPSDVAASPVEFAYDVAGILRVESEVALPELAYFRTAAPGRPDIRIGVGFVGGWPSRRVKFSAADGRLTYHEHLGAIGANFEVTLGETIEVVASPLLARSRHVLYTNVLEALLRFALVERGYVLLHSGCVARDGRALLLSAQTDTGKTSTVIRLVRDFGYDFLSDDMTIVSPGGEAIRYPKPMTMSYHTMSAIAGARLGAGRRASLSVQGRVHSRSGRAVGRALGTRNIPIMAINSATQIAVPPPKFHITSLVACEVAERAKIDRVVFIERGSAVQEPMGLKETVTKLIENTDDAYGFPPFATFAPHLRIGALSYEQLRQREAALLAQAIASAELWRLEVPGHGWAEIIAELDREPAAGNPRPMVGVPIESSTDVEQHRAELLRGRN